MKSCGHCLVVKMIKIVVFAFLTASSYCSMVQQADDTVHQLQQTVDHLHQTIQKQAVEIKKLKSALAAESNPSQSFHPRLQTGQLNETVAFSAYMNEGEVLYQPQARLQFEGIQYNTGDYSPSLSLFQCTTPGLYWFNLNIDFRLRVDENHYGLVNLVKGPDIISQVVSFSFGNDLNTQASVGVIDYCNQDELVFAEADQLSRVFGSFSNRRSTFVGLLIAK